MNIRKRTQLSSSVKDDYRGILVETGEGDEGITLEMC